MKNQLFKYLFCSLFFLYSFFLTISYNISNFILTILTIIFITYLLTNKKLSKSHLYIPIILFLIVFLISSFLGYDRKTSLREITLFKGFVGMIIAMNTFPEDKKIFEFVILTFLLGVFINISYSIFEKFKYANPLERVEGLWKHYQFYADFLMIAFFIEIFYITFIKGKILKIIVFLILLLTFFSLILTGSRAQIFFTILFFLIYLIILRKKIFLMSSLLIFLILFVSFLKIPVFYKRIEPFFFKNKKFGIYVFEVNEFKERIIQWKKGLKVLKTKYKFFGVGLGNSKKFIEKELNMWANLNNMHNSFIEILVSFGIIGFIIYIYLLTVYFLEIYKRIKFFKNKEFYPFGISLFLLSLIIIVFVGFLNDTFWNKRIMMLLLYFSGILFAFKNENTISV
jgi:O-antigen ligase